MKVDVAPEVVPLATDQEDVVRVGGSRVTLDAVVQSFESGATAEEIAQRYPSLALDDVYAVITYYLRHPAEVERYLAQRRQMAAHTRAENELRHSPAGLRERLIARGRS